VKSADITSNKKLEHINLGFEVKRDAKHQEWFK